MRERVGRGRGGGKYERVVVGYEAGLGDVGRDGGLASGVPRERLTRRWDEMALWQWPGENRGRCGSDGSRLNVLGLFVSLHVFCFLHYRLSSRR